ncbi:MAG: MBL fold metallo-hydrolase [Clostridiales bacterium]
MIFEQLNPHSCLTYLIGNDEKKAILIDPVIDHFQDYMTLLKDRELSLTHVIDTHAHADHISAGASLKDAFGCEYIMHESASPKCVTKRVKGGDEINLNGFDFKVLHTPGHTKDSISLVVEDKFLTGDFLFLEDAGAGRDDLPGGDPAEHWESLKLIENLDESLIVYPAHEYRKRKPSSLKNQKKLNPHLQKSNKEEFIKYLEDLKLGPADWMKDVLKANYICAKDPNAAWIPLDTPACEVKGTMEKGVDEIEVDFIDSVSLKKRIDENDERLFLLDVREKHELNDQLGYINGIKNISITKLIKNLNEIKKENDKDVVIICRSGARAHTAGQILKKSGINNVLVLEGGMILWRQNRF